MRCWHRSGWKICWITTRPECRIGEGGRLLSGGEQRRLGIARALLHNAPFLLLDEPTEGLDADTEQHILALLRDIGRDRTMLIITHRLQGLEHMDTLCVMDGGQIAEQGSHDALLARRGRYYQFVNRIPVMTGDLMPFYQLDEELLFPPVEHALTDPTGCWPPAGISPSRLLLAYREGIFPWYSPANPFCGGRRIRVRYCIRRSCMSAVRCTKF